jgi:hypothetical protein
MKVAPCTSSISCPSTSRNLLPARSTLPFAARRPLHRRTPCGSITRRPCKALRQRSPSPPGAPTPGQLQLRSSAPARPSPPTPRCRPACAFRLPGSMSTAMHGAKTVNSEYTYNIHTTRPPFHAFPLIARN